MKPEKDFPARKAVKALPVSAEHSPPFLAIPLIEAVPVEAVPIARFNPQRRRQSPNSLRKIKNLKVPRKIRNLKFLRRIRSRRLLRKRKKSKVLWTVFISELPRRGSTSKKKVQILLRFELKTEKSSLQKAWFLPMTHNRTFLQSTETNFWKESRVWTLLTK